MDARGCFVGEPDFDAAGFLRTCGGAGLEHQLERADLLVRGSDGPASAVSVIAGGLQTLPRQDELRFAPREQALEVAEDCDG
jgi:hypothetical protein